MRRKPVLFVMILVVLLAGAGSVLLAGTLLSAAASRPVGAPPTDLPAEPIEFNGIKGWYIPALAGSPCVILMHGVRADRRSMIERARLLHDEGYATLLFDFQAHGESRGEQITFGYLESANAHDAVATARSQLNCPKVAAIGQSMGGASALLGEKPIDVEALVIESVYPDIESAIADRLKARLGEPGGLLTPLLTLQLKYRLGIDPQQLRPIDAIRNYRNPLLIMAGERDQHTTLEESQALFTAANQPKEFWAVPGARHVDLYRYAPGPYRQRLLDFLARYLTRVRR